MIEGDNGETGEVMALAEQGRGRPLGLLRGAGVA